MSDPRFARLAEVLTGFSTELKKGERVLIDAFDVPDAFTIELVRAAQARGALPYVNVQRARITRELLKGASVEQYATTSEVELARMKHMQAYIAVRGSDNIFETSDVPSERVQAVASRIVCMLEGSVVADAPADQLTRAQITAFYFGAQRPEAAPVSHTTGSADGEAANHASHVHPAHKEAA